MPIPTGILVLGEVDNNSLSSTTRELLTVGNILTSRLHEPLFLGIVGTNLASVAADATAHGAQQTFTVDDPLLSQYHPELYLEALHHICRHTNPNIVLIGRTAAGREIGPRLAARLGVGLAQDCLKVTLMPNSNRLIAHRPVYGGNAIAAVTSNGTPQMVSIRPKVYEIQEPDTSLEGNLIPLTFDLDPSIERIRLVERIDEQSEGAQLETAHIVLAGGRGLGGPEAFKELEVIASILKAGIGASRAAVDAGWVPSSWQIGLTGKTITPNLYITVAISGASQHMAGCSGARVLVAINKDPEANIFREAQYGVVGDWQKVLPAFTETLRELME